MRTGRQGRELARFGWHSRCASLCTREALQPVVAFAQCLESCSMSSSRRSLQSAALRRPAGPRCHGGASSLLRLGFAAVPQRVAAARASGWCELAPSARADVEHVVGLPVRDRRPAPLWS
jgi:hypothetical protein